jgi:hypothetical protein
MDGKRCGRGILVGACRMSVSWILVGSWANAVQVFTTNIQIINSIWLPWTLNRHLIHHQTMFVGSIWTGNAVVEGHWIRHAEGLSHRFWLGFAKIWCSFHHLKIANLEKTTPSCSYGHWMGNRHLIHQTLFVGSIWLGNTVVEGHWMGHAECMSHGFLLRVKQ